MLAGVVCVGLQLVGAHSNPIEKIPDGLSQVVSTADRCFNGARHETSPNRPQDVVGGIVIPHTPDLTFPQYELKRIFHSSKQSGDLHRQRRNHFAGTPPSIVTAYVELQA